MTATSHRRPAKTPASEPDPRFVGLLEAARALQPRTVALRRAVHRHPERGLLLPTTQAAVLRALDGLPLSLHTGKNLSSVVAVLSGARPGPVVLLRADMDALPLTEHTGLSFASEDPAAMHACGHDTHVAMLVSAARLLCARREALAGQVVLMFQPGEEGYDGASRMIDEGLFNIADGRFVRAFALHITATTRSGVVVCRPGPVMASADTFTVRVAGRTGHAAMPHEALDPVPPAAAMVGALHTMLTRKVSVADPAVLTITRIAAGSATNVIPDSAELTGTVRALSEPTRTMLHRELRRVCEHVGAAHDCAVQVNIEQHGYPVTVNDDQVAPQVLDLAATIFGPRHAEPMAEPIMGAEDFSHVLRKVPGALAFLGACPPGVEPAHAVPNHSDRVLFDESAMEYGVALYAAFALAMLR